MSTEWILECAANGFESFLFVEFLTTLNGFKSKKNSNVFAFLLCSLLLFINISLLEPIVSYGEYTIILDFGIVFLYSYYYLKGSATAHILEIFMYIVGLLVISSVTLQLFSTFTHVPLSELTTEAPQSRAALLIISKLILFLYTRILILIRKRLAVSTLLKKHTAKLNLTSENRIKLSIIILLLLSVLISMIIFRLSLDHYLNSTYKSFFVVTIISSFLINIVALFLYLNAVKSIKTASRNEFLENLMEKQEDNYQSLIDVYEQNRMVAHDIKNTLTTVSFLIQEDNKSEALDYLHELLGSKSLQQQFVFTDFTPLDAILNAKFDEAQTKNIKIAYDLFPDIKNNISLSEQKLVVLLGNLLDNAIEATSQSKKERKIIIQIFIKYNQLCFLVKNTIDHSVLKDNPKLLTRKKDNKFHGIGLKSVQRIIKENNGYCKIDEQNGHFSVLVTFPLNSKEKKTKKP